MRQKRKDGDDGDGAMHAKRLRYGSLGLIAAVLAATVGCMAQWDRPRGTLDAPPGQDMARMQFAPDMEVDEALLDDRADEMRRVAEETREHVAEMRPIQFDQLRSHLMGHTAQVARLASAVTRHTRDMYQRFELDEDAVASHFGMRAPEHREMMEELEKVRAQAGRLQVARPNDLERGFLPHLDRLDAVAARVAEGAERMAAAR